MNPIRIEHHAGAYEVEFGPLTPERFTEDWVVTDSNIAEFWPQLLPDTRRVLVLPPGESTKSMAWLERVCSWLAQTGAVRSSRLVAVGGGVIGDLAGLAAATYMRGISYVQVPTTLLAQVDSSVGGKVAVDIPEGKNLVGAFHPPQHVLVDSRFLATLSTRQFRSGMAEVCKYGFIMDAGLAARLASSKLPAASDEVSQLVGRCIELKRQVVEADEFETRGIRAILNFGHTVGHALEQATGYAQFLHGEAIAAGMQVEARLGEHLGMTPPGTALAVGSILATQGIVVQPIEVPADVLLESMKRDKKARQSGIAFSLLTKLGGCKLVEDVGEDEIVFALKGI